MSAIISPLERAWAEQEARTAQAWLINHSSDPFKVTKEQLAKAYRQALVKALHSIRAEKAAKSGRAVKAQKFPAPLTPFGGVKATDWGYVYDWCDPKTGRATRRVPRTPAEWKRWGKRVQAVETANARYKPQPPLSCKAWRRG